ncbi:MAG TPA: glycosyltransferase family 2 protein [Gammaproteobacteria bacterium]|nr:glycosyltransferase family 2 protein [Gammaproteobacteria bacterium]|tara:strand:- start:1584 stop:2711 length:1128 start_codon:yes stop_codon:yes gene_type:complete
MTEAILWVSVLLVLYSYLIYPLVLLVLDCFVKGRVPPSPGAQLPNVAVILAAYNEADCIESRVNNLLNLDYPEDKLRIIIGDDGSSDATSSILGSCSDSRLVCKTFPENRGKSSVLNDLVALADAEVLVFTDANPEFASDVVNQLVPHFSDESVGAGCGELRLEGSEVNQDSTYWLYEQFLKKMKAKIGGLLGANGAVYAIRSELYRPLPIDTLVDDFTIVMRIALDGAVVVYEESAIAHEQVAPKVADEYRRRVRIGAVNYQAFMRLPQALDPRRGILAITYFSHKVLRWFTPHFLIITAVCLFVLSTSSMSYLLLFVLGVTISLLSLQAVRFGSSLRILNLLGFWLTMNIALLQGFFVYLKGVESGGWQSTTR